MANLEHELYQLQTQLENLNEYSSNLPRQLENVTPKVHGLWTVIKGTREGSQAESIRNDVLRLPIPCVEDLLKMKNRLLTEVNELIKIYHR